MKLSITGVFVLVAMLALRAEATPFFEDNFDGDALNIAHWDAFPNGYPEPAVAVAGGFVQMGQPGAVSLDFPYVASAVSPFPATGDFVLQIAAQYTSVVGAGVGMVVLGPANRMLFGLWNDTGQGLIVVLRGTEPVSIPGPTSLHVYSVEYVDGTISLFVDEELTLTSSGSLRPYSLWFGHPTVGQVDLLEGVGGGPSEEHVDPETGVVLSRWWSSQEWTTVRIDYIRVVTPPLDHFKCYKAKDLKNPKFEVQTVNLVDQLAVNDGPFEVKKPFLFCNPADKNGEGIDNPTDHLTCYKIKGPKLEKVDRPQVEATNQFGTLQLEAKKPFLLCVPSAKTVLP